MTSFLIYLFIYLGFNFVVAVRWIFVIIVNEILYLEVVEFNGQKTNQLLNFFFFPFQQMQPAKQAKMIREFQTQAAQMDMTVCSYA